MPHELPPALRSRCLEVFFRVLTPDEIGVIARHAAEKIGFPLTPQALSELQRYAANGRDAVNMVQIAAGICQTEGRKEITKADIEWVVNSGQYAPRMERRIPSEPAVGLVNGLAVYGPNMGMLINAEAAAIPVEQGRGTIKVTGVMDEEEIGGIGRTMRGRSQARNSVDNVITVLKSTLGLRPQDYDIHVNFPGGVPIDGPSAGVTMVTAIYSAIASKLVDNTVAMTGEVTIHGQVQAVGA